MHHVINANVSETSERMCCYIVSILHEDVILIKMVLYNKHMEKQS